jgi:hypothetical protein
MQQLDPKLELPPPRPLFESSAVAQSYPVQALGEFLGLRWSAFRGDWRGCGDFYLRENVFSVTAELLKRL